MMSTTIEFNDANFQILIDNPDLTTCILFNKTTVYSKGISLDEKVVTSILPVVMIQVSLAFLTSHIVYFLLKPLKQPRFVCNVLSGIIMGRSVFGKNKIYQDIMYRGREMLVVNTLATMGGIYFVFIITVKMDKAMILRTIKKTWNVSMTVLLVPLIISFLVAHLLRDHVPRINLKRFYFYIIFLASRSSFAVVVDAISELKLLNSELGQLTMSTAVIHELIGWLNSILSQLMRGGLQRILLIHVGAVCALSIFTIIVLRLVIQWIIRRTPERKPVKDIYIIAIMIGAITLGFIYEGLNSNYMIGAAMFGLVIPAGPPLGSALVEKSELIITNFFLPFFYIRLGQLTDIHSIENWRSFLALELILLSAYLGKVVGCILALIFFKASIRNALLFSCFLNIKGIIELMHFLRWRSRKYVDIQTFSELVLSNLVLTAIVTPLITIFYKPQRRLESIARVDNCMRTLQTTLPNSELRILCCIHHEDNVNGIITLLRASNSTEMSPICAYAVHLIDLVGRAAPVVLPYNTQKYRLTANSTDRIMRAVIKYSRTAGPAVVVQPFIMISPYDTMHQSICRLLKDKFIPLILVPLFPNGEVQGRQGTLHNFNINILNYAPCTVGVFVDRGLNSYIKTAKTAKFCYNVAVFFIGGPDDREAMALVSRMSGHPGVSITVFRIDLEENLVENENERYIDEVVMNEFMANNFGNANVVCRQMVANDTKQLVSAVRSLERSNDLVIVGRQQAFSSRLEEEMRPWVEYEELGIIGDLLASADFVGGMMSILVIQSVESVKGATHKTVKTLGNLIYNYSTSSWR